MNLATIRTNLAAAVDNVSGLRAHPNVPDDIDPPAALVVPGEGAYDQDFDGDVTIPFSVYVLASRGGDMVAMQELLDGFLAPTGSGSIKAAVDADRTLGGSVTSAKVTGWDGYGTAYEFGTDRYLGVRLAVEVYA